MKNALDENFAATSEITQKKLAEVVNALCKKVSTSKSQAQVEFQPQQNQDLERLRVEISQLKMAAEHSVEHVPASSDMSVGEV